MNQIKALTEQCLAHNSITAETYTTVSYIHIWGGIPGGPVGKESACNAGDPGSIPDLGRSPEEENGYPPQYSCLENPMDREAWWATVHGVAKSR